MHSETVPNCPVVGGLGALISSGFQSILMNTSLLPTFDTRIATERGNHDRVLFVEFRLTHSHVRNESVISDIINRVRRLSLKARKLSQGDNDSADDSF